MASSLSAHQSIKRALFSILLHIILIVRSMVVVQKGRTCTGLKKFFLMMRISHLASFSLCNFLACIVTSMRFVISLSQNKLRNPPVDLQMKIKT